MALHPSQITRRNFVQRAGLLVTALGLSGSAQTGIMESIMKKASRKWGSEALAQSANGPKFFVEICLRAGFQSNSLFPSMGHAQTVGARNTALNFYSSAANVKSINRDGRNAYIATFPGLVNQGGEALRQVLVAQPSIGLATSEVVKLNGGNHTESFETRIPSGMAACPAVVHASIAPPSPVQSISWNDDQGQVSHTAGTSGLAGIVAKADNRTQFTSLFRDLPMYFSREELRLIVGEFDATGRIVTNKEATLHKLDSMWRQAQAPASGVYNDNDPVVLNSLGGRNQSTLSLLAALDGTYNAITGVGSRWETTLPLTLGGASLSQALASANAAFANGASSTFAVTLQSGDWHTDINANDDMGGKQGLWNRHLGNALAGMIESAATLTAPGGLGGTVLDHLLISITSEFTRTPLNAARSDNGDGGQASFTYIGKNVKNGTLGDINHMTGQTIGFNADTGVAGGALVVEEANLYRTTLKLLGADGMAGTMGVSTRAPVNAVIKNP